jgi:hypothetical protein
VDRYAGHLILSTSAVVASITGAAILNATIRCVLVSEDAVDVPARAVCMRILWQQIRFRTASANRPIAPRSVIGNFDFSTLRRGHIPLTIPVG